MVERTHRNSTKSQDVFRPPPRRAEPRRNGPRDPMNQPWPPLSAWLGRISEPSASVPLGKIHLAPERAEEIREVDDRQRDRDQPEPEADAQIERACRSVRGRE